MKCPKCQADIDSVFTHSCSSEKTVPHITDAACSPWYDPKVVRPDLTGKYLVMTSNGPEILRLEEEFMEYVSDGTMASWDEIYMWASIMIIPSPPH